jgi:hypothetical protein
MYSIETFLRITGLLGGLFDGHQVITDRRLLTFLHYFGRHVFTLEIIKSIFLLVWPTYDFHYYLIELRFSTGRLRRLSSLMVGSVSLSWRLIFNHFRSYHHTPASIRFLQPLLPHVIPDPVFRLSAGRRLTFARLVRASNRMLTLSHSLLLSLVPLVIFRYTFEAYQSIPFDRFCVFSIPTTLLTAAASFYNLSIACFIIQLVFLTSVFFILRLEDEESKLRFLLHSQTRSGKHNRSFLLGFNLLLQQIRLFEQFLQQNFSLYYLLILMMDSLIPYMILYDNNPITSRVAIGSIYLFVIISMIGPLSMINTTIDHQVRPLFDPLKTQTERSLHLQSHNSTLIS